MLSLRSVIVAGGTFAFAIGSTSNAGDLFPNLLHHRPSTCSTCGEQAAEVVRLPAQDIRIETSRPRVIVNESSHRRFAGAGMGLQPMFQPVMPFMAAQPMAATFFTPMNFTSAAVGFSGVAERSLVGSDAPSAASLALRAVQEMEHHALELERHKAVQKAENDALDRAHQRMKSILSSSSFGSSSATDSATQLKDELSKLERRVSDVERLLVIHDNALKSVVPGASAK